MKKLTHQEILLERRKNKSLPRNPIVILLNDVRSLHNIGSIFRTADGIRAAKIYLCGISGKPPERSITKTALGAEQIVPWEYRKSALETAKELKSAGFHVVVMEHTNESVLYSDISFQFPVCLIVGNEVTGVDSELIELSDIAIEIPMMGEKNSLNVAVATGIAAYQLLTKISMPAHV